MSDEIQIALSKIGMTKGESRVYLALLECGTTSTGQIIDKSHITSSKVYLILERLEQKGLVSHNIENNVKRYKAADPKKLLDYMQEKTEEIEKDTKLIKNIIPQLQLKLKQDTTRQETTMFKGIRGFETARENFMQDLKKGDEYVVFASTASTSGPFSTRIKQFEEDNEKKGIKTRLIFSENLRTVKKNFKGLKLMQIRFTKSKFPSAIAISKTSILHMTYDTEPIQVVIKSPAIAKSYYSFFESIWNQSKE